VSPDGVMARVNVRAVAQAHVTALDVAMKEKSHFLLLECRRAYLAESTVLRLHILVCTVDRGSCERKLPPGGLSVGDPTYCK